MQIQQNKKLNIVSSSSTNQILQSEYLLWQGRVEEYLEKLTSESMIDLVVTSPPYNIGKSYEKRTNLDDYLEWQKGIITKIAKHVPENGNICWQVGNYVENGHIVPLDIEIHPIFRGLGFKLRNRIVWRFGHGLHGKRRFSGRYEMVLWYTRGEDYTFNLDAVRIDSKYPSKRSYKGPNVGKISSHPLGKNPEDFWEDLPESLTDTWTNIPNVKGNHIEKTNHPCQYPVGLVERLILALTNEHDLVFDPFCGVGTTGVAAALHNRRFIGCEVMAEYAEIAKLRIDEALAGTLRYRAHNKPLYDHLTSKLSIKPSPEDY